MTQQEFDLLRFFIENDYREFFMDRIREDDQPMKKAILQHLTYQIHRADNGDMDQFRICMPYFADEYFTEFDDLFPDKTKRS